MVKKEMANSERNAKALKSGIWYLLANLVVKAMALITTPIFTRLLTKEQFGEYSNFLSWSFIAIIIITMKMEASLISAKYDYGNRLHQYNLSSLGLTAVSTLLWILLIFLFPNFFSELTGVKIAYLYYMAIYCFFYAVIHFFQITERFFYRYKKTVAVGIIVSISSAVVPIILVSNMEDKLTARVIGGVVPTIVIGLFLLYYFIEKGRRIDFSVWPYALKICIPYIPHLLSLQVLHSVDRVMITRICGPEDNALYSVGSTCGHLVTLLIVSLNSALGPWLADMLHEKNYEQIHKVSKYYVLIFCLCAIPMMLLAPEILLIMGGKGYIEAVDVMVPVSLGCVCQFLYTMYVNVEQYEKKTVGMAFASVAAALLNYTLNLWLIPIYGYISAAYTTLAGFLFLLLIHMYLVRRIGMWMVYNNVFIIIVVVAMICIGLLIDLTYDHLILRYTSLFLFLSCTIGLGLMKKTVVMKIVKMFKKK